MPGSGSCEMTNKQSSVVTGGADENYRILEFEDILNIPIKLTRLVSGNLIDTGIDKTKIKNLGWYPKYNLKSYLENK